VTPKQALLSLSKALLPLDSKKLVQRRVGSFALAAPAGTRDGEAQEQLARQQGHEEDGELDRGADSVTDYASAALAGLPPDDEAAVIARLAAASGKSLKEVIDFSYTHGGIRSGTRCHRKALKRSKVAIWELMRRQLLVWLQALSLWQYYPHQACEAMIP